MLISLKCRILSELYHSDLLTFEGLRENMRADGRDAWNEMAQDDDYPFSSFVRCVPGWIRDLIVTPWRKELRHELLTLDRGGFIQAHPPLDGRRLSLRQYRITPKGKQELLEEMDREIRRIRAQFLTEQE